MGNYRFKFSDMIPNAWFYKLKDMNTVPPSTKKHPLPNSSLPRKSYYFPREETHVLSMDSLPTESPELRLDRVLTPETTTSLCVVGKEDRFHELPRIVTKTVKLNPNSDTQKTSRKIMSKVPQTLHSNSRTRRFSVHSPGKKIKIRSPKIQAQLARRMSSLQARNSLSESFAIVKSSFDPQRDFRESMLEMIIEHNMKSSKDLEDLLACYLSLNSDEYHDMIIKVFKQIWVDLTNN